MNNVEAPFSNNRIESVSGLRWETHVPAPGIEELKSEVLPLIGLVQSVSGLDENQARTFVYWALATHGISDLHKFPILPIYGPAGTGKTTLLEVLRQLTFEPCEELIDGKATNAVFRDSLVDVGTALIDEADDSHEKWLINRYSRQSSRVTLYRQDGKVWGKDVADLFGATALHRRLPFKDPAMLSRSIVIRTKTAKVDHFIEEEFSVFAEVLSGISSTIDWGRVSEFGGDRISDTWAPLLVIDDALGGDLRGYAYDQMGSARISLELGHEMEPVKAVYLALLSLVSESETPAERVLLKDVRKEALETLELNPWQIGESLRELGFSTAKVGGKQFVFTGGREKLVTVGLELGIEDEWFDDHPGG